MPNNKLTKTQVAAIEMTIEFLNDLRKKYGNAGCNDFSMKNTLEHREMLNRYLSKSMEKCDFDNFKAEDSKEKEIDTMDIFVVGACKLYLEDLLK